MVSDAFPRFDDTEIHRRHSALFEALDGRVDAVLAWGADRSGSAVPWLSQWPVTREAALLVVPGERSVLWVQFYNHLPSATRMADAEARWGGPSTADAVAEELQRRAVARLGVIGPVGHRTHVTLEGAVTEVVDLAAVYTRLRMVKSDAELAWLRRGAELSDRAVVALRDAVRPGMDERELGAIVEGAYLADGGTNHIHYFGVTSMANPNRCVPSQWPSTRRIEVGDVLTTEISASWWGYPGQVLRTMTIGADATPHYSRLHEVADEAYDAVLAVLADGTSASRIVDVASTVIDGNGFTIYDDLVHGYGGGYLPPVLGVHSRPNEPTPDLTLRAGMTVVVQPNVITPDERTGVQTGGLVRITDDGVEELQRAPRGLWMAG